MTMTCSKATVSIWGGMAGVVSTIVGGLAFITHLVHVL